MLLIKKNYQESVSTIFISLRELIFVTNIWISEFSFPIQTTFLWFSDKILGSNIHKSKCSQTYLGVRFNRIQGKEAFNCKDNPTSLRNDLIQLYPQLSWNWKALQCVAISHWLRGFLTNQGYKDIVLKVYVSLSLIGQDSFLSQREVGVFLRGFIESGWVKKIHVWR